MNQKKKVTAVFDNLAWDGSWEKLYKGRIDRTTYNFMSRFRAVEELLGSCVEGEILDVGCGTGDLLPLIIQKTGNYYGVDISSKMIERANVRFADAIKKNVASFHIADCDMLPFNDMKFNLAIAVGLIEYLPDPSLFLKEVRRILVNDGYFLVTVPYKECINLKIRKGLLPIIQKLYPVYAKFKNQSLSQMTNVRHYSYNENDLDNSMKAINFHRVDACYTNFHIIPHPIDHLFPELYIKISESIDRGRKGIKFKKFASNYIALFQKKPMDGSERIN